MAKNIAGIPVRRVSAEFIGDEAVDLEIIEVSLGLSRVTRSKSERDTKLMQVALAALGKVIEQYRLESGERYPEFGDFAAWLGIKTNGASSIDEIHHSSSDGAELQNHVAKTEGQDAVV